MQCEAAHILRKHSGLQGPDAVSFRFAYQSLQQLAPDACTALSLRNINAHFRDSPVDAALRNRTQGGPAGDTIAQARDQTRERKMRRVPSFPRWRLRLKRRNAGGNALKVDSADR